MEELNLIHGAVWGTLSFSDFCVFAAKLLQGVLSRLAFTHRCLLHILVVGQALAFRRHLQVCHCSFYPVLPLEVLLQVLPSLLQVLHASIHQGWPLAVRLQVLLPLRYILQLSAHLAT